MSHLALLAVLLFGCGRIGYEPSGAQNDGAIVDGAIELGAFMAPTIISELSDPGAGDDDPTLTGDELELYFNSNRAGGLGRGDIWLSTREMSADSWKTPTLVAELSTPDDETSPEVSADGLAIWFASDRPGGQGYDIWMSTRTSRAMPWPTPALVPELSSAFTDTAPTPGWDQLVMIFESDRPSNFGSADLYITRRATTTSSWDPPMPVEGLNTADHEGSAHLGPQELHVVFGGRRQNDPNLYLATRDSTSVPFGAEVELTELNSPENEQDPWISGDLRHIIFVSSRSGNTEIYQAFR